MKQLFVFLFVFASTYFSVATFGQTQSLSISKPVLQDVDHSHAIIDSTARYQQQWIREHRGCTYRFILHVYPTAGWRNFLQVVRESGPCPTHSDVLVPGYAYIFDVAESIQKPEVVYTSDMARLVFYYRYHDQPVVIEIP